MDAKPRSDAPHGMEPYDVGDSGDLGALSREQQTKLNNFKVHPVSVRRIAILDGTGHQSASLIHSLQLCIVYLDIELLHICMQRTGDQLHIAPLNEVMTGETGQVVHGLSNHRHLLCIGRTASK